MLDISDSRSTFLAVLQLSETKQFESSYNFKCRGLCRPKHRNREAEIFSRCGDHEQESQRKVAFII